MKSAFALLISSTTAIRVSTPEGSPVYVQDFHFNEDPHSVPNPLAGVTYLTPTMAKYLKKETWDLDTEVKDMHPDFHVQFNRRAKEPKPIESWMTKYWGKETLATQLEDDVPADIQNVQWTQTADLGELDDHATLLRESDNDYMVGKAKFHGWTNPLGWQDTGDDDDLVLVQMTAQGIKERRISAKTLLQYEESEGPTKVDLGDIDHLVIEREADNDYMKGKSKFHGWTNPLGWQDSGDDDDKIL